jgi:hypothetical protein
MCVNIRKYASKSCVRSKQDRALYKYRGRVKADTDHNLSFALSGQTWIWCRQSYTSADDLGGWDV